MIDQVANTFGMDPKMAGLMKYIIGESQFYSTQYFIKGDESIFQEWQESSKLALTEYLGHEPTGEQIFGLQSVARVLQTCDSGAYTRMGITRDDEHNIYYYNGNDVFTGSMMEPKDLRGRAQTLRGPDQKEKSRVL